MIYKLKMANTKKSFEEFARVESRIIKHPEVFKITWTPEDIIQRKETYKLYEELSTFMKYNTPNNLLLLGLKGSGKTVTVRFIEKKLEGMREDINVKYIRCADLTQLDILQELTGVKATKKTTEDLINHFLNEVDKHTLIILDEIDKAKRVGHLLYSLSRADIDYSINFVLVSNDLKWGDKLDAPIRSSLQLTEIVFTPYKEKELENILQSRSKMGFFKEENISKEVIKLIAKKTVDSQEGDCRVAITSLFKSGQRAEKQHREEILEIDVNKIFNKVVDEICSERLSKLTDAEFIILFSCLEDEEKTINSIYKNYREFAKDIKLRKSVKETMFFYHLEYLESQGLIKRRMIITKDEKGIPRRLSKISVLVKERLISDEFEKRLFKLGQQQ